jgi:hypothetical protein
MQVRFVVKLWLAMDWTELKSRFRNLSLAVLLPQSPHLRLGSSSPGAEVESRGRSRVARHAPALRTIPFPSRPARVPCWSHLQIRSGESDPEDRLKMLIYKDVFSGEFSAVIVWLLIIIVTSLAVFRATAVFVLYKNSQI